MITSNDELQKINQEWIRLKIHWEKASEVWNDAAKIHFEDEYWQVLERQVLAFIKALEATEASISKAYCQKTVIQP